jgi:predicted  nucleic acid-binding Zn-ribbon protein
LTLADQVSDLALLVRLLLAVSVVQLLLLVAVAVRGESTRRIAKAAHDASPVFLAKAVEALTASIDELTAQTRAVERRMGAVEEVVEQLHRDLHAVEGDASDASAAAEHALDLVRQEAADEEREFVAQQERRRTGGGE